MHCVDVAMQIHQQKPPGDILIFLTGRSEIERAVNEIYRRSEELIYERDVSWSCCIFAVRFILHHHHVNQVKDPNVNALMVLPVYGTMATKAQQQIFMRPPPGVRKIVVATDIASTSLTIDGIV